jgi:hypothetical protein
LQKDFDAVLLTGGAEQSRDLPVPGRDLDGVHFAMEFLPQQNKVNAGDKLKGQLSASGKHVIVIGGGDTGSDCVGTSNRHGAASVTQFEVMPMPPEQENKPMVWPYWPLKLRTSSSHDEGCTKREFAISTKEFTGKGGKVSGLKTVQVEFKDGKMVEVRVPKKNTRPIWCCSPWALPTRCHDAGQFRCGQRRAWQCQGHHRFHRRLCHQCAQGFCGWRYSPRARVWWCGPFAKGARPHARWMSF